MLTGAPSRPDAGHRYRPALDGLRAVAVGGVVAYHLGYPWLPGGFLGVDLFFVLSGYLITGLLLDDHARHGRIDLMRFWARRARRLLPALLLTLLAVAVAVRLWLPVAAWAARRDDLIATLLYYANWHFIASDQSYFAAFAEQSPLRHAWSLAIEEQFYLVWPFLVAAALRWWPRRLVGALAVAAGASAAVMVVVHDPASPTRAYVGTDARAQQLLIGALLALLARRGSTAGRWSRRLGPIAALAAATLLVTVSDTGAFYYTGGASLAALAFAALIWSVEAHPASAVARLLSVRGLRAVGAISYGLYLWHWPVLVFSPSFLSGLPKPALDALRVMSTVALAVASFYLVERPIREGRPRWAAGTPARVAMTTATAVLAGLAVIVAMTTWAVGPRERQVMAAAAAEPCPDTTSICVRITPRPGHGVVAVLGDSIGRSLDAGVVELARRRGWGYVLAAHNGCNLAGLHNTLGQVRKPWLTACAKQSPDRIRQVLDTYRPTLVIAVSRWELATHVGPGGDVVAPMSAQWATDVRRGLRRFAQAVTASGAALAVLPVMPQAPTSTDCLEHPDTPACAPAPEPAADATNAIYGQISTEVPGMTVLPLGKVCPGRRCPVTVGGRVLRHDAVHFTADGARWLIRRMEPSLIGARRAGAGAQRN